MPYEITLFSNTIFPQYNSDRVLIPYEITLFSNNLFGQFEDINVLIPYEITLFSKQRSVVFPAGTGFNTL